MICPACSNHLSQKTVSGIVVDVCEGGCGGIWFDNFELQKLNEPIQFGTADLLNISKNPDVIVDRSARRDCPKCEGLVMMRHFFSDKRKVEVDECPGCGGIWLDEGELMGIRKECTEKAMEDAQTQAYFGRLFGQHIPKARATRLRV